ncbi:class II fructose-bisphosphatase [Patescibacteria group bacterium]|nr:class II fructose-bisphosphatase [Patescibacteria group bacterium]MBU0776993.1 class II fructose-bisphosphatase [Patescibacteria group bacterium]MBU0846361.1 class II fructose-bisphosphatase [Patescibacteria group bacterium]MBU0923022.1 class II fructose-bisphosphatase [Patescibacteria group bacterium]MBU1066176.1 class II fructose-bisphosphatase [Patescibacteria group bacterium]
MPERLPKFNEHSPKSELISSLSNQFMRATEYGAMAAAWVAGFGDKTMADKEATRVMREYLNSLEINGTIVTSEGERDKAPMLRIGEMVGTGNGPELDIAVDALENTNATATLDNRAISVMAVSERGGLFRCPDMYMNKLVVGKRAKGKVNIDASIAENLKVLAEVLNRETHELVIVVLKRERNEHIIQAIKEEGARVREVRDGDLLPGIAACQRGSGIHALMGIGAAPEGVITAAAVKCLGGGMQARFWPAPEKREEEISRLIEMGGWPNDIYTQDNLASGKMIIFSATGVTDGDLLKGVKFFGDGARIQSLLISKQKEGPLERRIVDATFLFKDGVELRI